MIRKKLKTSLMTVGVTLSGAIWRLHKKCHENWWNCLLYKAATSSECVHLVTRGHFRSRDKDVGHTIRSAIGGNPMLHANFTALCFIETELWPMEVLHCGINRDFFTFFAPVTLTSTRWPSYTNLTRTPLRYTGCAKMKFPRQGFRKLSYCKHTDRQTPPKLYFTVVGLRV